MAQKKYVSIEKLTKYDELLKAKIAADDAGILAQAKAHAEGLSDNYEAAGSVATAKEDLQKKIDAVDAKADGAVSANTKTQGEVDGLKTLVGTLPETATASDVVGYIDEKTSGIATDATVNALASRVGDAEDAIDAIEADYLKAADKAELSGLISTEKSRAEGIEGGLRTDIDAIKADYLKAEDKTALETSIAAAKKAGDDAQADIDAFFKAAEVGDAAIDTLKEIQDYITSDGAAASTMTGNISANAKAISDLKDKVGAIPEGATATDVVSYAKELVTAEETRATGVEGGLDTRLKAVESAVGTSGSVATDISTAKQEAIDSAVAAAAADATSKADKALEDAKAYADAEDEKIETRVSALETASATHAKASDLTALTTRVATAEGEIDTLQEEMDAVEAKAAANEAAIGTLNTTVAGKVSQTDFDTLSAKVDANTTAIGEFVECSEAEILALFNT